MIRSGGSAIVKGTIRSSSPDSSGDPLFLRSSAPVQWRRSPRFARLTPLEATAMSPSTARTAEFIPPTGALPEPAAETRVAVDVEFGALSHPGNVRPNNEDHYAVVRRTRSR